MRNFFDLKEIDADWAAIEEADDEFLVASLAMVCPFEPREKQALLRKFGDSILIFKACHFQTSGKTEISMLSPNFLLAGRGSGPVPTKLEML
ncbi:MAG: hypothetical protein V3V55_05210 [Rhodospirillales bacterium]